MKRTVLLGLAMFLTAAVVVAQNQAPAKQQPAAPAAKKAEGQKAPGQGSGAGPGVAARKQIIYPPEFKKDAPYSPAVRVGPMLFISGQIGNDLKTGTLASTFEGEVRNILDNIGVILKAAGMDYSNVVSVTVYMTDMNKFPDMNKIYVEYFKADRPARATVGVAKLVGASQVEISAIAHQ